MSFSSVIKIVFCLVVCFQLQSQNDSITKAGDVSKYKFLFDEERQYLGTVSLSYQSSSPYGDNFIGKGFDGKGGFSFSASLYVFKNLFVGYSYGINEFDTVNTELLGNYRESTIEERYFIIGYEFLLISKVRFGVNTSIGGSATLSNSSDSGFGNRDSGKLWSYGLKVEYEFIENLNFFIEYSWRQINTNIEAPQEIAPFFEKGTYRVINFGLKFNFGREDLVDKIVF
jgi:predicted porin